MEVFDTCIMKFEKLLIVNNDLTLVVAITGGLLCSRVHKRRMEVFDVHMHAGAHAPLDPQNTSTNVSRYNAPCKNETVYWLDSVAACMLYMPSITNVRPIDVHTVCWPIRVETDPDQKAH